MQTTFKGWPLYYYIQDKASGDTLGQGLAGVWFAVIPTTSAPPPPTTTSTSTTSTSTTSSTTSTTTTTTTTSSTTATTTTTTTTSAGVTPITINLVAQNLAFNMSTITVPAGASVTVNFNNKDSSIPHNFAVYTDSSGATKIFSGTIITGPATTTYTFVAPSTPGTYFFRCDVHPTQMTGSFIVTAPSSGTY